MKVEDISYQPSVFNPVTLNIKLETEKDFYIFMAIANAQHRDIQRNKVSNSPEVNGDDINKVIQPLWEVLSGIQGELNKVKV